MGMSYRIVFWGAVGWVALCLAPYVYALNDKSEYIELDPEELEAVAIESKHTLEIEEFVPKKDIDELYLRDPYYIVPDGDVSRPLPSSATPSVKRTWWRWARSYSPLANTS